jgi:hypothetical protein
MHWLAYYIIPAIFMAWAVFAVLLVGLQFGIAAGRKDERIKWLSRLDEPACQIDPKTSGRIVGYVYGMLAERGVLDASQSVGGAESEGQFIVYCCREGEAAAIGEPPEMLVSVAINRADSWRWSRMARLLANDLEKKIRLGAQSIPVGSNNS